MPKKLTTTDFIEKARLIHGDKFSYDEVEYNRGRDKVKIKCNTCQTIFLQNAASHLVGIGCPICANNRPLTKEDFIKKANEIHNSKYDYSKINNFENSRTKVEIVCHIHGSFFQSLSSHLSGHGCKKCGREVCNDKQKLSNEEFIKRADIIHKNKYDYTKINYTNKYTDIEIICPDHGSFLQLPQNHLRGQGCPYCARISTKEKRKMPLKEFIERANIIHNSKYNYDKVNYINGITNIEIICPEHGSFLQLPQNHLQGKGCPYCSHHISKGEQELIDYIKSIYKNEISCSDRNILDGKELDIFIPEKKIAFEFNGLRWHSEEFGKNKNYHLDKTEKCLQNNIQLIHIFEDEWLYKKQIVKNRIKHLLHLSSYKIYARKCVVKNVDNNLSNKFLEKYHIQGKCPSSLKLGLFYKNRLVALMTFGKPRFNKNYDYELLRYCTIGNFNIIGGASKLLSEFKKNNNGSIISYADRRWSKGNLYKKLGFKELNDSPPNYYYFKGFRRFSRVQFQKHKLNHKLDIYDENLTESENMFNNNYFKVWDCGNKVFVINF